MVLRGWRIKTLPIKQHTAIAALPARVTRLLIVPDGALHDVSFDVLAMSDGRLVVERFALGSAPSAAIALALWRRIDAPSVVSQVAHHQAAGAQAVVLLHQVCEVGR